MRYRWIKKTLISALEREVETYLSEGWELYGPPLIRDDGFYQAMTFKEPIVVGNLVGGIKLEEGSNK